MLFFGKDTTFDSKYFGQLDLKNLDSWYDSTIDLNGKTVEIAITFMSDEKKTSVDNLKKVEAYLDNFAFNVKQIESLLADDYNEGLTAKEYIDILTEEIDEEDLVDAIENYDQSLSIEDNIFQQMHLINITFYPEKDEEIFAILDYTISKALTNELLVARLNRDNSLDVMIES